MKEGPRHRHQLLESFFTTAVGKTIVIVLILGVIGQILYHYLKG